MPSVFDQDTAVDELKSGQLALVLRSYPQLAIISDDFIWQKIREAEQEVSRRLGIALIPTEIFPDPPTADELAALDGGAYKIEPGYDLTPGFFSPDHWGMLQLRQKPVIAVHAVQLVYPLFQAQPIDIPASWVRVDHKYGQLNIVPSTLQGSATLSFFMTTSFYNSSTMPNMLRVRYSAGLTDASEFYPDIIGIINRLAIMRLLHDSFIPQSGTISADGLSQTRAVDTAKMQASIDAQLDNLKTQITGMTWAVF